MKSERRESSREMESFQCCVYSLAEVRQYDLRMMVERVREDCMNVCNLYSKSVVLQGSDIESKVLWRSRGKFRMVVKVERGGSWVAGGRSVPGGRPPAGCREVRSRLLFILKTESSSIPSVN